VKTKVLARSKHHAQGHGTLRHCVALVQWPGEYSTHYEVTREDGSGAYFDTGHYFQTRHEAQHDFRSRLAEFESRYARYLEEA